MERYNSLWKKNRQLFFGVALMQVVAAFGMVFAGYSLGFLFRAYEQQEDRFRALLLSFGLVTAIWLGAVCLQVLADLSKSKFEERMKNELRASVGESLCSLSYGEFVGKDAGNMVSCLTNDVEQLYEQSFESLLTTVERGATALFSLAALFYLSPIIGIAAILLFFFTAGAPALVGKKLQRATAERSSALEVATESYKDVLAGGSVFFLADLRRRMAERIRTASETAEGTLRNCRRVNIGAQTLVLTASLLSQVLLLVLTLFAVLLGKTPVGAMLSVGNLAGSFFNSVGAFLQARMTFLAAAPLWDKYPPTAETSGADREFSQLALDNVSVRYGDRKVLDGQTAVFERGKKYAVMGESGSGKSTLVKLLLGLLPNYEGEIRYDKAEQRDLSPRALYRQISYVEQEIHLFQDSLRFNLTLGEPVSDEELRNVLKTARLEEFVASLPEGLDTRIAENGKNLSGGQRQRIALARGLLRKTPFLILDEATSALDETNAREIETALLDDSERCIVFITHHLREPLKSKSDRIFTLSPSTGRAKIYRHNPLQSSENFVTIELELIDKKKEG